MYRRLKKKRSLVPLTLCPGCCFPVAIDQRVRVLRGVGFSIFSGAKIFDAEWFGFFPGLLELIDDGLR